MENGLIAHEVWRRLEELIEQGDTFAVTTHVNPDGDAVGCSLAVFDMLEKRGKRVRIFSNNGLPEVYTFLAKSEERFATYSKADDEYIENCDAIFVLDISTLERLGEVIGPVGRSAARIVCIDHHPGNRDFADITIISEQACATAELVFEMYVALGAELTAENAEYLYTAILTDTEGFSNSHTVPRAHEIVAALLSAGVDAARVYRTVYREYSWARFDLLVDALKGLKRECDGKFAWMKIDRKMVERSGALREEIDGFVDFPMSIAGVRLSILFLEVPGRGTKISLRSYGRINVNEIARRFGGGGHRHSSGIRLFDTGLDAAVDMVVPYAIRAVCEYTE